MARLGLRKDVVLMKEKGTKTRYPGVYRIESRVYRITGKYQDPRTGKDRWIQRLLEGVSAHEAAAERKRLIAEAKHGPEGSAEQVKIGDYARSWLKSKALHVDVSTAERYGYALRHALDHLGEIFIQTLRSTDIQQWVDDEIRAGYSPDSIRGWFSVLRTMVRDAAVAFDLPRDPTRRVRLPESVGKAEDNAFEPRELVKFLDAMREHFPQHYALTATLAMTGLRFCHVSPLKWEDIDLTAGKLTIRRKQVKGVIGPVSRKKRAPRVYPIGPDLVAILRWHRALYPGLPGAWVFPSRVGKVRVAPSTLYKAWAVCLKHAGVKRRVTVHGLRRTFTDLARLAEVDGVVSRSLVGHTERMREHYSHVREAEQRRAVNRVLELVREAAETTPADPALSQEVGPRVGPAPKTENALPADQA